MSPDDVILEGDLIAYRPRMSRQWTVAAVVSPPRSDTYVVRPVVQRDGALDAAALELFVDWTPGTADAAVSIANCDVRLLDADFEERIVQDRIENPHGEQSEYCWRVNRATLGADTLPIPLVE